MKQLKLSTIFKHNYVKAAILVIIIIGSVIAFQVGLSIAFRTQYPLRYIDSGSMTPTLNIGDLIIVQGFSNASEIKATPYPDGDIVVFQEPGNPDRFIVHRAIESRYHDNILYFRTQGDASYLSGDRRGDYWSGLGTWDGMVSERLVVGKVVGVAPWIGHIPRFIRSQTGIFVIIVLLVISLLIIYFPSLSKKQKAEG